MSAPARRRLTGTLRVPLPPARAFPLFTPYGERAWVQGWDPRFPDDIDDIRPMGGKGHAGDDGGDGPADTRPGTVFQTHAHGETTTWVVVDRRPGRRMAYARVTPGARAGTVEVDLDDDPGAPGHSVVTVTYDLTAMDEAARAELGVFAAGYGGFLRSWEEAIAASLARDRP
ncbi:SRPBCC family protein [Microbispora sp. NPDC049125]|uniref:SRPBCC family protein n=1 Tax=Microbispora sp. NPDC049125 TaxID=3154929 RepID=UPI003465A731